MKYRVRLTGFPGKDDRVVELSLIGPKIIEHIQWSAKSPIARRQYVVTKELPDGTYLARYYGSSSL